MSFLPEPDILLDPTPTPEIPLPKGWSALTLQAILHTITLARIVILNAACWPNDKECDGLRLRVENDRLLAEVNLLKQELAIKDARFARLDAKQRPEFLPTERLEILTLKAARGWSNVQTANRFHVAERTVRRWIYGVETGGDIVQLPEQVNRYPDYVRSIVQRLKACCPMLGRYKIADILARAGLHISASTVRRIIQEPPKQPAEIEIPPDLVAPRVVTSKYPDHLWGGDITLIPTVQGLAMGIEPEAIPQEFPYCFHVLNVIDHFSRRLMGEKVFTKCPTGADITKAFEEICCENAVSPKHLVLDHGAQFYCREMLDWCKGRNVKPRFGAVGRHGSIAVVERLHLSMKEECTRRIIVPLNKRDFEKELSFWQEWYNSLRPHMTLKGKTPDEVYFGLRAANTLPRLEPRPKVHHSTPCAKPRMMMAGKAGRKINLHLSFLDGRSHLPILTVQRE